MKKMKKKIFLLGGKVKKKKKSSEKSNPYLSLFSQMTRKRVQRYEQYTRQKKNPKVT